VPAAPPSETDFEGLLRALSTAGVEFIVIGGVAGKAHGSPRLTVDLDVVYARTPDNLHRLTEALAPLEPYLRGAPPGLPFRFDPETVRRGLNFTLRTTRGDLDLLGEVVGGGGYDALLPHSRELEMFGLRCRCLDLDKLIEVKRAAGRPKDLEAIAELEAIREERRKRGL
jgi:predicted nucleotidyltransferase